MSKCVQKTTKRAKKNKEIEKEKEDGENRKKHYISINLARKV